MALLYAATTAVYLPAFAVASRVLQTLQLPRICCHHPFRRRFYVSALKNMLIFFTVSLKKQCQLIVNKVNGRHI